MKQIIKNTFILMVFVLVLLTGCENNFSAPSGFPEGEAPSGGAPGGSMGGNGVIIEDDGSTTNYVNTATASPTCVVTEDLYENFTADGTVYVSFDGSTVTANLNGGSSVTVTAEEASLGKISDKKITVQLSSNTVEDEANEVDAASNGIIIQYKGTGKIKYVLSGNYTGTVFIKNKNADAAVVLNNVTISSDSGAGPVLRFSSEKRTFIVVPAGTTNTLTDTRVLNQSATMYDDKKGSVYSKGSLIFTGEESDQMGGSLSIVNTGYKHAVYSKDYVRIANLTLNVTVDGTNGRDCIRTLNAVIIDGGTINLTGKGTILDDESVGIKVEGEDADDDDMTVEYTAGAGFVIINGGNLTINTVAKGITAHWKSDETVIGNASYTATANASLLYTTYLAGTSATTPNPFVEINGGIINITTTGEPYEGSSDSDPSCSPEGIESKGTMTINAGTLTLKCTDDALNSGGNLVINNGAIYAYSSKNDAIDSNGSIIINDGVIVALGMNTPECAFDCDNSSFSIRGGLVLGLGTENYSAPGSCTQTTAVLASSSYGSAGNTMAIFDGSGNPVFVYTLPSSAGSVMVLSSPSLSSGTTYTVKTGVSVSGGTRFHNLYTTLPTVSGGSSSTTFSASASTNIYTDSISGMGGMGGMGGMRGPGQGF
ncbi:MAG: carbohydrate-binding domain-containing protein [Treponemataceae bacterium]|nr:carbohydrate-binding domain-containing protein [Treponemataceae bacterium]